MHKSIRYFLVTILALSVFFFGGALVAQADNAHFATQVSNQPLSQIQAGDFVSLGQFLFVKTNNSDNRLVLDGTFVRCPADAVVNYPARSCTCTNSSAHYGPVKKECIACPANSSWRVASEDCACNSNFYASGGSCSACPANSTSIAGSTSINSCQCDANYYMDNNTCVSCPANSASSKGSTSISACSCEANYYKNNNTCVSCPVNSSSSAGSTAITNCICNSGYNWIASNSTCKQCPSGSTYNSSSQTCVCDKVGYGYNVSSNTCVENGTYSSTLKVYYDPMNCTSPIAFMDSWTGCSSLGTHATVCLLDPRDHRSYRVRKLADGLCWMIDSLKFGGNYGTLDGCSANDYEGNFNNGGSSDVTKAQETFVTGYYGHCRAIPGTYTDNYHNDTRSYNNYLYDWVAAMQSTLAYNGSTTSYTAPHQGICPSGWHIPTDYTGSGSKGEFGLLYLAYNCTLGNYVCEAFFDTSKANFTLSGYANNAYGGNGNLEDQGVGANYWSSIVDNGTLYNNYAYCLYVGHGTALSYYVHLDHDLGKDRGGAVRCIKD
ncbi:hypothetical protein IJJ27_04315 [bacterium]|nr:hypothetical protein [bacterium]